MVDAVEGASMTDFGMVPPRTQTLAIRFAMNAEEG
jgi:hypothetical protein